VSAGLWGVVILLATVAPTLPLECVAIAVVGSAAVTFNSAAKTLLQLESAAQMRGRVMSLWSISWQGSTVVGAPVVGGAASLWGARYGLAVGGVATLLVGVVCFAAIRRAPETVEAATPETVVEQT
jgi:sugar phosphate permease